MLIADNVMSSIPIALAPFFPVVTILSLFLSMSSFHGTSCLWLSYLGRTVLQRHWGEMDLVGVWEPDHITVLLWDALSSQKMNREVWRAEFACVCTCVPMCMCLCMFMCVYVYWLHVWVNIACVLRLCMCSCLSTCIGLIFVYK